MVLAQCYNPDMSSDHSPKTWQSLKHDLALRAHYAQRATVLRAIREFFWNAGFLETETPQLVSLPSMEPYLEVFETTLLDDQRNAYRGFLTSSPEFAMKKLLSAGYENIFQVCKSYRNMEGWSSRHNPEFTILEWYRTNADYTEIMDDCEKLLAFIGQALGVETLTYQGKQYPLNEPWERISVLEAFARYAHLDRVTVLDHAALLAAARTKGYVIEPDTTWDDAFNQIFLTEIEPHLGSERPTILYDYPAEMAALSRRKPGDPVLAERFEFYVNGLELGNAFSELTDADEQLARLTADRAEKERLGRTLFDVDSDFIDALRSGMPPTAGIAVGVDRLVMLFLDVPTIQDTLYFPANELWEPKE